MIEHRPVLAAAVVFDVGHPGPDDFAGIRVPVNLRRIAHAQPGESRRGVAGRPVAILAGAFGVVIVAFRERRDRTPECSAVSEGFGAPPARRPDVVSPDFVLPGCALPGCSVPFRAARRNASRNDLKKSAHRPEEPLMPRSRSRSVHSSGRCSAGTSCGTHRRSCPRQRWRSERLPWRGSESAHA